MQFKRIVKYMYHLYCKPFVTEAGSGVVSEQRNRLVATIKFIYAGIQKLYKRKKRVIAN